MHPGTAFASIRRAGMPEFIGRSGLAHVDQHKGSDDIAANLSRQRSAGRENIAEAIERHWPGR